LTFILDENISPKIAAALRAVDQPVSHATDIAPRGTPDEQLFLAVSQAGFFLVTQDQNMARKRHQRAALLSSGVGVFIFTGKASRDLLTFTTLIFQALPRMTVLANATERPFIWGITDRREFTRLD
jgi:predicted nuclease of predicted toxin-antitoxin system